ILKELMYIYEDLIGERYKPTHHKPQHFQNISREYILKGISFSNFGRYEEAIEEYNKAIEIDPRDYNGHYNKGNSLSNLGRNEEAIEEYNKAIEIDPRDYNGHYNKGISLLN